jgi:hypothetical protein
MNSNNTTIQLSEEVISKWVRQSEIDPKGTNQKLKMLAKENPYTARRISEQIHGQQSAERH